MSEQALTLFDYHVPDVGKSGADFSPCRSYRYKLWRQWSGGPTVNFLMLNPSTADHRTNDPTVERCERRAREWGYGRLVVTNLFALRSTEPAALKSAPDPIGPENDAVIAAAATAADLVVCAWGNDGNLLGRAEKVYRLLARFTVPLSALKVSSKGEPCHPLYLPYSLKPEPYHREAARALLGEPK